MALRVAIDLDSTLSGRSFLQETLNKYNYLYDDNLRYEQVLEWELDQFMKCSTQEMYDLWTPEFIERLEPEPYAKFLFDELKRLGHEPFVVTAFSVEHCVAKVNWCRKHLGINEDDIIFCRKKYRIDCDVLIDDGLHNFYNGDGLPNDKIEKVVYTQPYNLHTSGLGWHYRVNNLRDVLRVVKVIEKNVNNQK